MLDFDLKNSSNSSEHLCCNETQLSVIVFMAVLAFVFLLLVAYKYLWKPTPVASRRGYMNIDGQHTQSQQTIYDEPNF